METKKVDIVIDAGDDFIMPFTLYDFNNNIVDLTGATIEAHLRQCAEDRDYIPFEVFHNGKGGRITIKMFAWFTGQIPYSSGVYDVAVNFPNGTRLKPLKGDVSIVAGSTR